MGTKNPTRSQRCGGCRGTDVNTVWGVGLYRSHVVLSRARRRVLRGGEWVCVPREISLGRFGVNR